MRVNFAQALCLALIGGPALGGLVVTLAGAGAENWRQLFAEPGLAGSVGLTLSVGFAATAAALGLAMGLLSTLVAANAGTRRRDDALALAPLLASPHSTLAVGLAFLIAPSGWIARLLSPLFGWTAPPDVATVGDPHGLALTLGLVVKETPFLLAVALAALRQFPVQAQMQAARALGYSRAAAFALIVAPQLYARIRWPVYAVLAYSLSVVDMALVLAPSHPAPLSLIALRGLTAPDLDQLGLGQAAATLQLALVVASLGLWRLGESFAGSALRRRATSGARGGFVLATQALAGLGVSALTLGFASLTALAVWAFAWRWPFPAAWPSSFSLGLVAAELPRLAGPLGATLALGFGVAAVALALAVLWLEGEDRIGRRAGAGLIVAPLLIPQIAFLFGVETLFAKARLDGGYFAVAWAHLLFVFPYCWLTLADPWRALDPRYARAASALGASRRRTLLTVKLPILAAPLALAFAVGFAVSAAQYLATLFPGGGRVATLTTEALALASGGDRRLSALLGLAQALPPLALYAAAMAMARR